MAILQQLMFSCSLAASALIISCQPDTANRPTDAATTPVISLMPDTYSRAVADARWDFAAGRYEVHSLETLPVENAYYDVLRMDYGIQWHFVGTMRGYYACYNSVQWELLERQFGPDFLARVSRKADSLNRTGRWNTYPEVSGGTDSLLRFIYQQINWHKTPLNGRRVYVGFTIQPDGQSTDFAILKGAGAAYDAEALRVLRLWPRLKSG